MLLGVTRNRQFLAITQKEKNIQNAINYIVTKMHMPKHTPKNAGLKNKKKEPLNRRLFWDNERTSMFFSLKGRFCEQKLLMDVGINIR